MYDGVGSSLLCFHRNNYLKNHKILNKDVGSFVIKL